MGLWLQEELGEGRGLQTGVGPGNREGRESFGRRKGGGERAGGGGWGWGN